MTHLTAVVPMQGKKKAVLKQHRLIPGGIA